MKTKLILTLTLLSLFGFNALAVNPGPTATTNLQKGHYYRIHSVSGDRYMCYEKQDPGDQNVLATSTASVGRKQPIIFIKKDKALTSPGTIFKLEEITNNGVYKFVCQGEDVNNYMNRRNIGFSAPRQVLGIPFYNGIIFPNRTFEVTPKDAATSKSMYIKTEIGNDIRQYDAYLQDEGGSSIQSTYLSVGMSKQLSCEFYFEEVTGEGDAYLSLPLNDPDGIKTYSCTVTYFTNVDMTEQASVTGTGTYGISDTKHNTADNSYYTSACFSFPVVVPNEVHCFFMNAQNNAVPVDFVNQRPSPIVENGFKVMPAGTPFIVQTATNDPSLYKFYPLYPGHFAQDNDNTRPTNLGINKLEKANTYFVAQARNSSGNNGVAGMRLLAVDGATGEVLYPQTPTLGNDELTDGNRAYYGQKSEPIENKPTPADLVDLIYEQEDGSDKYTESDFVSINDELVVGYVNEAAGYVFAHDKQNNKNYPNIQPINDTPSNYFNFNPDGNVIYPADYYQSNWVAIYAPNELSKFTEGCIIPANTVTGSIATDKKNPMFNLFAAPDATPTHDTNNSIVNTYSIAHLAATNHELAAHSEHYDGDMFWFMQPRAMEVATIVWAVLKYENGAVYAYVPKHTGNQNDLCFKGKVSINPIFYDGNVPSEAELEAWDGQAFSFRAVILKGLGAKASSPLRAIGDPYEVEETEVSQDYIICPLSISEENITTAIDQTIIDSLQSKVAKEVRYYNLQGIESSKPFDGVNIVVITYDDGSRSSMKMIK